MKITFWNPRTQKVTESANNIGRHFFRRHYGRPEENEVFSECESQGMIFVSTEAPLNGKGKLYHRSLDELKSEYYAKS